MSATPNRVAVISFVLGALTATAIWLPVVADDATRYAVREIHHHDGSRAAGQAVVPEPPPDGTGGAAQPAQAGPPTLAALSWSVPAGWTALPPVAGAPHRQEFTIAVDGIEAVCVLAIWAGTPPMRDPLANFQRWRSSIGLPSLPPQELAASWQEEVTGLGTLRWAELRPEGDLPGLIVAHLDAEIGVLSLRLMGPPGEQPALREGLLALARSLALRP